MKTVGGDYPDKMTHLHRYYREFCKVEVDFLYVTVPPPREGFTRLHGIPQGLTPNQMFEVYEKNFPCWRWTKDLDTAVRGRNEREPKKNYLFWVRDRQEADKELKNLSADKIREMKLKTETLTERLSHGGIWYYERQTHLDVYNINLCSGSRAAYGYVPRVDCGRHAGHVRVDCYFPDRSGRPLCSREVVSL